MSLIVHPVKIAIIEALLWIDEPLSANELSNAFDFDPYYLGLVSYHVRKLAELGMIEVVATREVRGSRERYYYFRRDN